MTFTFQLSLSQLEDTHIRHDTQQSICQVAYFSCLIKKFKEYFLCKIVVENITENKCKVKEK